MLRRERKKFGINHQKHKEGWHYIFNNGVRHRAMVRFQFVFVELVKSTGIFVNGDEFINFQKDHGLGAVFRSNLRIPWLIYLQRIIVKPVKKC